MSSTDAITPVIYHFECADFEWRVRAIVVEERLSQPLCVELRLLTSAVVVPEDVLGVAARVTIERDGAARTFVGELTRVETVSVASGETHARVRFEPLLARARRGVHYRIFQRTAVVDIAKEMLGPIADCDFEVVLDRERASREYCVQYGESDLDFAMRQLQDEGIAWYLDFSGERTVMHLVEAARGYPAIATEEPEIPFVPDHFEEADAESIQSITMVRRQASPSVVERNWKWILHAAHFEGVHPEDAPGPHSELADPRRLDSPDEMQTQTEIYALTKASARSEHERMASRDVVIRGSSNVTAMAVGHHFLFDFGREGADGLLILAVLHHGDCPEVELGSGAGGHGGQNYTNTFECQFLGVPHRPQRTIPRPRIHSLHTAIVTSPAGEEIGVGDYGTITVRMHWDRSGSDPELSSCRLRVAQMWAGAGWGTVFIPRVGMEVLVAFLDGDPERPLCVGTVYNNANQTPYSLPDERTKSTIRTQSSPGGDGYNELTFEDAAGAEEVYVRAQRNLRTQVLHNESRSVGADQSVQIGNDQTLAVEGDRHTTIKGNHTLAIDGGGTEGLAGSQVTVKGAVEVKVTDVGTVLIEAAERIEFRVGGSTIVMDGQTIQFQAGAGTMQRLDEAALVMAGRGSLMRLSSTVMVNAATGASLQMDGVQTALMSNAGSHITLSDTATVGAGLGSVLELTADATLNAATITATAGQGAKLVLDANAAMEGLEASCTGGGGSLKLGPSGAALDGTKVDVTAAAAVSVVAPMVKIN